METPLATRSPPPYFPKVYITRHRYVYNTVTIVLGPDNDTFLMLEDECQCGTCDGRCGPTNGCPCKACAKLLNSVSMPNALSFGDRVRVKLSVSEPKYKWGSDVSHKSMGILKTCERSIATAM